MIEKRKEKAEWFMSTVKEHFFPFLKKKNVIDQQQHKKKSYERNNDSSV